MNNSFNARNQIVANSRGDRWEYAARGTRSKFTPAGGAAVTYTFDAAERLTADGTQKYAYDAFDRLLTARGAAFTYAGTDPNPIGDGTHQYAYDPNGTLAGSRTGTNRRIALPTIGRGDLIALADTNGNLTATRAYDPWGTEAPRV